MGNGTFIQVHRKIVEWEWYKNNNTKSLFFHCLIKANWQEKQWQGKTINRGQFTTSIEKLSYETGLTIQQTRTALNNLISTNEITKETTSKYTIITVIKYSDYQLSKDDDNKQINKENNNQTTNEQQTTNKQITTTNKDNNYNKDNNTNKKIKDTVRFVKPNLDEIRLYIQDDNLNVDASTFFDYYESNGWVVGKNKMKDWKATLRNWSRKNVNAKKETKGKSVLDRLKDL